MCWVQVPWHGMFQSIHYLSKGKKGKKVKK